MKENHYDTELLYPGAIGSRPPSGFAARGRTRAIVGAAATAQVQLTSAFVSIAPLAYPAHQIAETLTAAH